MNEFNCYKCGKFLSYDHLDTSEPVEYEPDYEYYAGYVYDEGGTYRYNCKKCETIEINSTS
jgi:hypothetical protein